MEKTPHDKSEHSDFIPYPTNKVIGIIDDPNDCKAALHDLRATGFRAGEIEVLTGEEGAHRIDVTGKEHGTLARLVRSIQRLGLGDLEPKHIRRYEQAMLAGQFCIGVSVKKEEAREKVHEILKAHHGHFINFYGEWEIEGLER